jgi:hypothetical protein
MLGYANARWLPLLQGLETILEIYSSLTSPFMSEKQYAEVSKQLYSKTVAVLWLSFVYSQASLLRETIKVIKGEDNCATESTLAAEALLLKLRTRRANTLACT